MCDSFGKTMCVFLCGLAVGVGAGILAAPRSGAETRKMLREKAEEMEQRHMEWHRRMHKAHEEKAEGA